MQLQFSVIPHLACMILLLTFVTYKSDYLTFCPQSTNYATADT